MLIVGMCQYLPYSNFRLLHENELINLRVQNIEDNAD